VPSRRARAPAAGWAGQPVTKRYGYTDLSRGTGRGTRAV